MISQTFINNCTYNPSLKSSRQCRGNLKDGPKWDDVNLDNCSAKSKVTDNLIELSKIKLCNDDNKNETECQSPVEVSSNLSQLIDSGRKITTRQDLKYIKIILKRLVEFKQTTLSSNNIGKEKKVYCYTNEKI